MANPTRPDPAVAAAVLRDYHLQTQHHLHRYADALGYMDWATQPDPFRRYVGAPRTKLALTPPDGAIRFADVCATTVPPAPIDATSVARLLQDSLALSAWKEYRGNRWALRVNPSSGNLHPTEGYLLTGAVPGLTTTPSLFHYAPDEHALERRAEVPLEPWRRLTTSLPEGTLLLALTSIAWREAWKYGERAYRYCMHDVGHALGAIGYAAAALGWRVALLPVRDEQIAALLGFDGKPDPEAEHPDCLLAIHPLADAQAPWARAFAIGDDVMAAFAVLPRTGTANRLSREHHPWPAIDAAITASQLHAMPAAFWDRAASARAAAAVPDRCARTLFHQRRSAMAMDGKTGTTAAALFAMLQRANDPSSPPFAMFPCASRVHLVLFVHRVNGLLPGLYCLVRGGRDAAWLRQRLRPEFVWERAAGAPVDLSLYLLLPIDAREVAAGVSCQQAIAGDSAFAVGMLAEFAPRLQQFGAWGWRLLHWEAGAIGQLLYLEAEANGLRGTGIGCFFDSAVHELAGIESEDLRTIYHFTVGGAVDDARLRTEPPYPPR